MITGGLRRGENVVLTSTMYFLCFVGLEIISDFRSSNDFC